MKMKKKISLFALAALVLAGAPPPPLPPSCSKKSNPDNFY
jgi:hypothetical protein